MASHTFETPLINRNQRASLTPPSPPSKKFCVTKATDLSSPCDSLCLPSLDNFDDDERENGLFLPTLAPRLTSTFPWDKLSINDEKPSPFPFTLKKRPASALTPLPFQPCCSKQKVSVHALCA